MAVTLVCLERIAVSQVHTLRILSVLRAEVFHRGHLSSWLLLSHELQTLLQWAHMVNALEFLDSCSLCLVDWTMIRKESRERVCRDQTHGYQGTRGWDELGDWD